LPLDAHRTRALRSNPRLSARIARIYPAANREELAQLRRENKRLKMEREILAKATAWFAQETTNSKRSSDS
jgi:transposase-like protein